MFNEQDTVRINAAVSGINPFSGQMNTAPQGSGGTVIVAHVGNDVYLVEFLLGGKTVILGVDEANLEHWN
jgi:hypothetical protein